MERGTARSRQRPFSSRSSFHKEKASRLKRKSQNDPFVVLGVSEKDQYSAVKKSFLKLAMKHHPDTATAKTKEEEESNRETFMKIREAFEALVEGPQGIAVRRSESDKKWEEDELNSWFKNESGGLDMPYMDIQTMKEVAEMTAKIGGESGGLDRDGGMWTLARMVTQTVEGGGDGSAVLQLEAGAQRGREINGILRRKRKW